MPAPNLGRRAVVASLAAAALVVTALPTAPPLAASAVTPGAPLVQVPASDDATRVELDAGGNQARFRASEVLVGRGVNEPVGTTSDVSGAILIDPAGQIIPDQSTITVDLRSLQSDSANRDRYVQRNTLQTDQFPHATFAVTDAPGLPHPLPASGEASFQLVGDLTVHGVTRPTTWDTTVTFGDGQVAGTATTRILITDFGMTPPKAGPVLSIEDELALEIDVRATVSGGPLALAD
ncbi:MAG: YceI family protein [Chloroflexi bacterium]|nr:YceI family protein [Chloroflexota bacterium]